MPCNEEVQVGRLSWGDTPPVGIIATRGMFVVLHTYSPSTRVPFTSTPSPTVQNIPSSFNAQVLLFFHPPHPFVLRFRRGISIGILGYFIHDEHDQINNKKTQKNRPATQVPTARRIVNPI
jgi:hypothetical protein